MESCALMCVSSPGRDDFSQWNMNMKTGGTGAAPAQIEPRRILSHAVPWFLCPVPLGGSLGVEVVVLLVLTGFSVLLGDQLSLGRLRYG